MKQVRWFCVPGLCFITLAFAAGLAAQAGDTASIQQKLYSQFKLTTMTADRSDIVTAGDVVVIHKPGLLMYAVASPCRLLTPTRTARSGRAGAVSARI